MTTIDPSRRPPPSPAPVDDASEGASDSAPGTAPDGTSPDIEIATAPHEGYRYSDRVVAEVANSYGIENPRALLEAAVPHDDGNRYLNRTELTAAAEELRGGELRGYQWSDRVLHDVAAAYSIDDPDELLKAAVAHDDGNRYLNRGELTEAADRLSGGDLRGDLSGYHWSPTVLARIMSDSGLDDEMKLLREAIHHDDGNRYLKGAELEAAAKVLTGVAQELGVISDLDKTIIPAHRGELPDTAYPGVAALFHELEFGDGDPGDTYYVTARTPDRITEVPEWLGERGLPEGTIDTGVSTLPWVAEREKVADIGRILEANPDQSFLLFGDTSHRDPEVYSTVLEQHPGRVKAAFLHRVNNVNEERAAGMFLYKNYAEVAGELLRLGVLDEQQARRVMVSAQVGGLDITDAAIEELISRNRP